MKSDDYQILALRTECPYPPGHPSPLAWVFLVDFLTRIRLLGERLDPLKKHLFYGKDLPENSPAWSLQLRGAEHPHIVWDTEHWRLLHGLLGKTTELAELIAAILPYIQGHVEGDAVNMAEEVGDSRWYDAIIAEGLGMTLGAIDERNISKLEERFGGRFIAEQASMRNLLAERAVLEGATGLDFGAALRALKRGSRVARAGWNGKGMWLALSCDSGRETKAENFWSPHGRAYAEEQGGTATVLPCILMKTAGGEILMGWLASQTDMLANDWEIVS